MRGPITVVVTGPVVSVNGYDLTQIINRREHINMDSVGYINV